MRFARHAIHRSDAEIFAAARRALDRNPRVPAAVRVHVNDGTVMLTGSVRAMWERDAADQTVRGVDGAHGVENDIYVINISDAELETPDE
jgi:osmotically-inducible protein OsmY